MTKEELSEKIKQIYNLINYQNVDFEWNDKLREARKICNEIQFKLHQKNISDDVCEHLHQKWEGEYPHNCKKVCQVCREVLN